MLGADRCVDAYFFVAVFRSALGQPRKRRRRVGALHAENSASLYMLDVDPKLDALRTEPSPPSAPPRAQRIVNVTIHFAVVQNPDRC